MNLRRKTALLFTALFLLYFVTRLFSLTLFPIFNDESTYIRYGMHQLHEPDHQPYSLLIGKEPLMPFLYAMFGSINGDYLLGARLVTVLVGALTLLGLCLFIRKLTDNRTAFVTGLLYIFAPYTLFFDRLALMDSAVNTVAIWSLYLTYRLFTRPRWREAIWLGLITGVGLWIKTSTLFYVLLPLLSYGVFYLFDSAPAEKKMDKLKMYGTALFLALLVFLPLFSNEKYAEHLQLLQQYTYPIFSVFFFPIDVWWKNLSDMAAWFFFYLTPPLCLLGLAGLFLFWKKKSFWLVSVWFIIPLIYEILYAKLFTSRHSLLLVIPLLIFAGYAWNRLQHKNKQLAYGLLGIILLWGSVYNVTLLTNPQQYPSMYPGVAGSDLKGYVFGFSSGYGVLDAIQYLKEKSAKGWIVVLIRNDHGNPEDAVVGYLMYQPNIRIYPLTDPTAQISEVLAHIDKQIPIYFVSRGDYYAGMDKYFVAEKKFRKPNDTEFVGVERIKQ